MPFHKRTVEPVKMCRLDEAAGDEAAGVSGRCGSGPGPGEPGRAPQLSAGAAGGPATAEGAGAGAGGLLFTSLEQVSAHSLVFLLWQLSDLSRCAGDIFAEIEGQAAALGRRAARLHGRLDALQVAAGSLDHRKVKIPVSNLDEESRWTVHYTAPWHQQENVFLPTTRPPCVEDLHRQAKLNLKSVLRECDKLRRDGYRSSQYYSQGPTFSKSSSTCDTYKDEDEESDQKCSVDSSEEEKLIATKGVRAPTSNDLSDINTQTNWTKSLPLPTPEEKMRQQAQTVQADVVPINVTGENFDRQASLRRSLIYTDTVVRRPKKVKRRKTITGIPDNIQKELATGTSQNDFRGHSMYVPDHCSTLGRLDNYRSVVQRSETRDSSCQTDEVKVVPPSMRRIRAQKGQGIAAQMSQFSISSGNMSVMSDSAGVVFPPRLHNDGGFHSLPRPGTRVSLQPLETPQGVVNPAEDLASILSYQTGKLQVDEGLEHVRCMSRLGMLSRPKSEELRHHESEKTSPACVVSPYATYSTSLIANATISSSSEVVAIHTVQNTGQLDSKITSSLSYAKTMKSRDNLATSSAIKDDHQSSSGNWSENSSTRHSQTSNVAMMTSLCDSDVSLNTPGSKENGSQNVAYNCRNNLNFLSHFQDSDGKSESSYPGDRAHGSIESWEYKASCNERASLHKPCCITPGYSTPASNMSSSSLDRASVKEDASSVYSVDHDGFYTSMHMDSGLKSGNLCNSSDGFGNPRHSEINVFDGNAQKNPSDRSQHCDKSLPRNISLKKAKKPPLPPFRTDSLRRSPKKKTQPNGQVLNETLIATLQHSLQLNLQRKDSSSPSQSPCSDYEEPWLLRSRSQSTVSTSSSMVSATAPNVYSLCAVTPSQSDTSSVKSEYGDPWGYYIDCTGMQENPGKPSGTCPPNAVVPLGDFSTSHLQDGSRAPGIPQVSSGLAKPKNMSPEKSHRVTSPSSGYSSQSNTPTALTPVPVFLKSISPGNGKSKLKPKVPERKSSLISSVSISSSSTSLSSNTSTEGSVNMKKLDSAIGTPSIPPLSPTSVHALDHSPLPLPPPPLADTLEPSTVQHSPLFPPPPPEALASSFLPADTCFPLPPTSLSVPDSPASWPPPPPSSLFPSSVPPPAPPLDPKLMKETWPSLKKCSQQDSSCAVFKQPLTKEETTKPPIPLITTKALQMVRLRPVKKPPGTSGAQPGKPASETESQENNSVVPQGPLKPSSALKHRESINGADSSKDQNVPFKNTLAAPAKGSCWGQHSRAAELVTLQRHGDAAHAVPCSGASFAGTNAEEGVQTSGQDEESPGPRTALLQEQPSSPKETHGSSPSRKPPPISKKPKLFLVVPPPHIDFTAEKTTNMNESVSSPARGEVVDMNGKEAKEGSAGGPGSAETDFESLVPEGGAAGSTFLAAVEADVYMVQPGASPAQGAPKQEEPSTSDEGSRIESSEDRGGNVGSPLSRDDGNSGVFEADMVCTSPCLKEDGGDEVTTPSRPRTTEDLFAAIHRSKRKVLGRKDSDDDHSRNHSPSPPVTPTGAAPSLASLKQAGSIQRSIRKSSTSSDNFKALLLKKGSRTDASSRMSAAEMLKNTDPRFQRSRSEPSPDTPDSPSSCSPNKNRRAQEEWAKNEGLMPRSLSFSGTRYGRSRTPPSAASSRYSMRNRIQSSPMTVISEGEGEAMESTENRIHRTSGVGREKETDGFTGNEMDSSELPHSEEHGSKGAQAPNHLDAKDKAVSQALSGQCRSSLREES
ncbi:NHS-like protein 1 isoform X1 [Vombatus ursinus]|uniref:NHS-like protein 1 isoform X1 n=1 Tax=Vombatus ursinus TaxID=29139 RepID=UPI000FFD77BB|nr:NHS-like protein 1 isoform X1 [Vombatus ursinus]